MYGLLNTPITLILDGFLILEVFFGIEVAYEFREIWLKILLRYQKYGSIVYYLRTTGSWNIFEIQEITIAGIQERLTRSKYSMTDSVFE